MAAGDTFSVLLAHRYSGEVCGFVAFLLNPHQTRFQRSDHKGM
jgi:hypothetical protein